MKSWNLNFLEPSGPLQTCNGTALPLTDTAGVTEAWALLADYLPVDSVLFNS